jgi:hypothetical protein
VDAEIEPFARFVKVVERWLDKETLIGGYLRLRHYAEPTPLAASPSGLQDRRKSPFKKEQRRPTKPSLGRNGE